ncbi:MAG: hypothetical protein KBH07_01760 [Flavobacteriales bacterium]|nr:hypothetical protein [Flavobacteriales bacterium]MBP9078668.1 hypothetical protein [Flavobacteriales bacterium]
MRLPTVLPALLLWLWTAAQTPSEHQFALSLSPSTDGRLFCLFLVKVARDTAGAPQVVESRPLSRENFIRQVQGRAFSAANPGAEDLFRTYGVVQCTLPPDSAAMGFLTDCSTLDNLWKLRYWEYPLKVQAGQRNATGWSEKPLAPSPRQMEILGHYGLESTNGLIIGEDLFRLLRDMGRPQWVNIYRGGS